MASALSLTNRDITAIRDDIINYIKSKQIGWTDFSQSDIGMILVDVMAGVADMLNYYIDAQAREAFLMTASEPKNIRGILDAFNYPYRMVGSAKGTVTFYLDRTGLGSSIKALTIPKWTRVFVGDINGICYVTTEEVRLKADETSVDVPVIQGAVGDVTLTKASLSHSYKYTLDAFKVPKNGVRIEQANGEWKLVDDAFTETSGGKLFSVHYNPKGQPYILFSFDWKDYLPESGSEPITISYLSSLGTAGVVGPHELNTLEGPFFDDHGFNCEEFLTVDNELATYGAEDEEDWIQAKANARKFIRSMGRAVTIEDYEGLIGANPNVNQVYVADKRTNADLVEAPYLVKAWVVLNDGPADETVVTPQLNEIKQEIDKSCDALVNFRIFPAEYETRTVDIAVVSKVTSSSELISLRQKIEDAVVIWGSYKTRQMGTTVYRSELQTYIASLDARVDKVVIAGFDETIKCGKNQVPYIKINSVETVTQAEYEEIMANISSDDVSKEGVVVYINRKVLEDEEPLDPNTSQAGVRQAVQTIWKALGGKITATVLAICASVIQACANPPGVIYEDEIFPDTPIVSDAWAAVSNKVDEVVDDKIKKIDIADVIDTGEFVKTNQITDVLRESDKEQLVSKNGEDTIAGDKTFTGRTIFKRIVDGVEVNYEVSGGKLFVWKTATPDDVKEFSLPDEGGVLARDADVKSLETQVTNHTAQLVIATNQVEQAVTQVHSISNKMFFLTNPVKMYLADYSPGTNAGVTGNPTYGFLVDTTAMHTPDGMLEEVDEIQVQNPNDYLLTNPYCFATVWKFVGSDYTRLSSYSFVSCSSHSSTFKVANDEESRYTSFSFPTFTVEPGVYFICFQPSASDSVSVPLSGQRVGCVPQSDWKQSSGVTVKIVSNVSSGNLIFVPTSYGVGVVFKKSPVKVSKVSQLENDMNFITKIPLRKTTSGESKSGLKYVNVADGDVEEDKSLMLDLQEGGGLLLDGNQLKVDPAYIPEPAAGSIKEATTNDINRGVSDQLIKTDEGYIIPTPADTNLSNTAITPNNLNYAVANAKRYREVTEGTNTIIKGYSVLYEDDRDPVLVNTETNKLILQSHKLNTLFMDSLSSDFVEIDHTESHNSKLFIPNTEANRQKLPVVLFSNWGSMVYTTTNRIDKLPALIEMMQPYDGYGIVDVKIIEDGFKWTQSITSTNLKIVDKTLSTPLTFKVWGTTLNRVASGFVTVKTATSTDIINLYHTRSEYGTAFFDAFTFTAPGEIIAVYVTVDGGLGQTEFKVL